jgi:flavin-dependent dehydrogenase
VSPDVIVAGGGLAGAAAACRLAKAGRRVVLLEREPLPHHKVCGEFVSVEAVRHLEALDADGTLAGLAPAPIGRVRLIAGRVRAESELPFRAWGLSRLRLDAWLLEQAERAGAEVRRGVAVRSITASGSGVRVETTDGALVAQAALLATGKHELRGRRRPGASALVGLKMHLRLAPEQERDLDRHVELVLLDGGYAGLQRVEGGLANLCLLVGKERFAQAGRDWRRVAEAAPHLARRLAGSVACWARPLAVAGVPYGHLHADDGERGVYRVGDQAAVIPSFTGDGMAIALHSAALAADAIIAGRSAAEFHRKARRAFGRPVRVAGLVAGMSASVALRPALVGCCRAVPGAIAGVARLTRVSRAA